MLPTTGLVGGCGIGNSLFFAGIFVFPLPYSVSSFRGARFASEPGIHNHRPSFQARRPMHLAKQNLPVVMDSGLSPSGCPGMTTSTEPPSPPFDQLGRNLLRLFLLRPMAGVPHQIF